MLVRTLEDKFEELESQAIAQGMAQGMAQGRAEGEIIGSIRTLQRVLGRPISAEHDLCGQDPKVLQRMLNELNTALGQSVNPS